MPADTKTGRLWLIAPLAITVFASAFLLFLVQSLLGKHLLPWFGGTPSVWATCLLFFQIALLAGYIYAWLLDRLISLAWQPRVHWILVGLSLIWLAWQWSAWGRPLLPLAGDTGKVTEQPIGSILAALALGPGLPFVALSATSPLLQRWAAAATVTDRPYRLFALSNAGSLLGLFSFPFFLEPAFPLPQLGILWGIGFLIYATGLVLASIRLIPRMHTSPPQANPPSLAEEENDENEEPARSRHPVLWLVLAACPSALLLATTNHICQEVAMVPLLWILPLALYLISFILAFDHPRWYSQRGFLILAAITSLGSLYCSFWGPEIALPFSLLVFGGMLFSMCMLCHGELERAKPEATHLTRFYLVIAAGGAVGGMAVALGAPLLLKDITEFHIAAIAAWAAVALAFFKDRGSPFHRGMPGALFLLVALAGCLLVAVLGHDRFTWLPAIIRHPVWIGCGLGAITCLLLRGRRPLRWRAWPILLVMAVIFIAELFMLDRSRSVEDGRIDQERNFFGVVRVKRAITDGVALTTLVHGRINHGFQYLSEDLRRQPAGYCGPSSGAGLALLNHPRRGAAEGGLRVGVAGLGVGAMAAYLRDGDYMRFYEINPTVIDWAAGDDAYFTYISDSKGATDSVLGDARLSLEQELAEDGGMKFDLILLDAFSSDAVPVHLLTLEAFEVYRQHLRDEESAIVVNISNRFIDFEPLLDGVADHFGWKATLFVDLGNQPVPTGSLWIVLAPPGSQLGALTPPVQTTKAEEPEKVVWTDAHSDIFRLIRWKVEPRRVGIVQPLPANLPIPAP